MSIQITLEGVLEISEILAQATKDAAEIIQNLTQKKVG